MEAQLAALPRISINLRILTLINVWNNECFNLWCWRRRCLDCALSTAGVIGTKEVSPVLVSHSKLLLFLVVDCQWKCGVFLLTKYVRN
jgi:hypothetical protein